MEKYNEDEKNKRKQILLIDLKSVFCELITHLKQKNF